MAEAIVELRNVTKQFDDVVAVDNVSLQIDEGEFFSLLGPSGCGKTTNLRMIAGFDLPTSGEIFLKGENVGRLPPFKRNVNTVFQNYALFPHMTIAQNIGFGLEMKGLPKAEIRQRIGEMLDLVHLPEVGDRRPDQLSGGQSQRVALARAIINRPDVLLLDEPLSALDLKLRQAMRVELKDLQHRLGITFVFVTHDQEEAMTMSDRIAVMDRGQVLQVGTPAEIYDEPSSRFVADFIGETNFIDDCVVESVAGNLATVTDGAGLKLSIADPAQASVGTSGAVIIRPEKIDLHSGLPTGQEDLTVVAGNVIDKLWIGTDTHFTVRLNERTALAARHQNMRIDDSLLSLDAGDTIYLSWQREAARLLVA